MEEWTVVAEPVGENPGLTPEAKKRLGRDKVGAGDKKEDKGNVGGVVIYVQKGRVKEEVTRVGFLRKTSSNPKDGFRKKLDEMIGVAKDTCDVLNKLNPDGPLQ